MSDPGQCSWCSGGGTRPQDHDKECAFRQQMVAEGAWEVTDGPQAPQG